MAWTGLEMARRRWFATDTSRNASRPSTPRCSKTCCPENLDMPDAGGSDLGDDPAAALSPLQARLLVRSVRWTGRTALSRVLGVRVSTASGSRVGAITDLIVDLGSGLERPPVTKVVIGRARSRTVVQWAELAPSADSKRLVLREVAARMGELAARELLARRDVLDTPVVLADPPLRTRVSDVILEANAHGAWIVGVDVSTAAAFDRLVKARRRKQSPNQLVPLSQVHLVSPAGHAAQLRVPDAMVYRLTAKPMAEVLTRVPVAHGRDIVQVADPEVLDEALPLLHPHVRARLTGEQTPLRRMRRLAGWRIHDPQSRANHGFRRE